MHFTKALLAALSAAVAQAVIITNADFSNIQVGVPFVITYSNAVGPVTVYLGSGTPSNVIQGAAVGSSSGSTGSISWTPTSGGSFALKIVDSGDASSPTNPNYTGFFNVAGPVASTTTGVTTTPGQMTTTSMSTSMMTPPVNGTTTTLMTSATPIQNGTTMTSMITSTGYGSSTGSSNGGSTGGSTGGSNVPTQVPNSMASGFASSLAFVFVAVGALLTIN